MAEPTRPDQTTSAAAPFLGVERSLTGRRWELEAAPDRAARHLAQTAGIPDAVARILAARGVAPEAVADFLTPSLKTALPDPSHLLDLDKAVTRLVAAIHDGEGIAVFGDYDVDGATSSAVLTRYFRAIGVDILVHIPDRMKEGYGPNLGAMKRLRDAGASVVLTVDCGITAFDPLAGAADLGLDVIVVDHHAAEPRLPMAHAVINPNRLDDASPHKTLAAVGVTFLLVVGLNRALRAAGHFRKTQEPDLMALLDLVALGTVADVVPLTGLNRALVTQGLKVMAARRHAGLRALSDIARLDERPSAYHLGFLLGPRVNAGGRVGEPGVGARLLSLDDPSEAMALAARLDRWNAERREIEAVCLEEAIAQAESGAGTSDHLIFVSAEGWHAGVIGIVASRLKERYNRPACVVARENGIGKGSGRSVGGVDLGAAVIAARQAGLLENGGGHRMAAGFTVTNAHEAEFRAFLDERIREDAGPGGIVPRLMLNGALAPEGASLELVRALESLAPFGAGNPEPRFALSAVRIGKADVVGQDHVSLRLPGGLKAIAFKCVGQPLGTALLQAPGGMPLHLAGKLRLDTWQGNERAQLIVEDAAPVVG